MPRILDVQSGVGGFKNTQCSLEVTWLNSSHFVLHNGRLLSEIWLVDQEINVVYVKIKRTSIKILSNFFP